MKFNRAVSLFIYFALVAGYAAWIFVPASASLPAASTSAQRAEQVSAERLSRHVAHLASDKLQGRRAGTPAADTAAHYIAKEFRNAGLNPIVKDYLQPFSFVTSVRLGNKNSFQVKAASGARSLKTGDDYMPLAFSSSDPASGQVVLIGYGLSAPELQYDNYAGIDVAGKIVLAFRGSPDGDNPHGRFAEHTAPGLEIQKKTIKAREKGARGIVFVSSEVNFKDDRLSKMRHDINFLDAGIPAAIISRQMAESIFAAAGTSLSDSEKRVKESATPSLFDKVSIEFKTDVIKVEGKTSNVVGVIEGSDPQLRAEYIVIGAHYDHLGLGGSESLAQNPEGSIHHGADDNASGTSALIEIARVLSAQRSNIKRSVLFMAFGAEEIGLLGSAAYTKNPIVPLASTVAMFNMDMVGRLRDGSLTVGGVGTSPYWKPLLEKLNAPAQGGSANGEAARFKLSFNQDGFGPSDHQSFYVRDIPVLFFFTGTHDDYHKPSDTAEKINTEGVRQIAEFVREIATSVANEPQRIAFTRVQTQQRGTGRGFRVSLGTVPNYSDQDGGLKLDGVRAGSPAEKAGLRAGDVVIKLSHMQIKNVYDYTYALGELKPGEEIDVVVRRDGQELKLRITPEKRQ